MGIFNYPKTFNLYILSNVFYSKHQNYETGPFEEEIIEKRKKLGPFKILTVNKKTNLKNSIKQGEIKGDWIAFKAWYNYNKKHLLFRDIEFYNQKSLGNLFKYGSDRHDDEPIRPHEMTPHDVIICERHNLKPRQFTWAYEDIKDVWDDAMLRTRRKDMIIIVYDKRLLKKLGVSGVHALREGVKSFKEVLLAYVWIHLRF